MTTTPAQPEDSEEAVLERRVCASCGHTEDDHEVVEVAADSRVLCRACDSAHEFEPEPED